MSKTSSRAVLFAREMRRAPTRSENRLWSWLRSRRFGRYKFRRQQPFGPFILDFYCPELRLAIEIDGRQHDEPWMATYDGPRDLELRRRGIEVVRVSNDSLRLDSKTVEEIIGWAIEKASKK